MSTDPKAPAEGETLRARAEQARKALVEYLVWHGARHDEDCPCDDTCECSEKWVNDGVNDAVQLLAALHARDTEIQQAQAEVDRQKAIRREIQKNLIDVQGDLLERAEAAESDLQRLREAVQTYGQHKTTCPCAPYEAAPLKAQRRVWPKGRPTCTCGFAALLPGSGPKGSPS